MEAIESDATNKIISIISDGRRTSQKCFASLSANSGSDHDIPWFNKQTNIYLLFDYVRVIKIIRNNWLTEKHNSWNIQSVELLKWQNGVI